MNGQEGLRAAFDSTTSDGLKPLVDIGLDTEIRRGPQVDRQIVRELGGKTLVGELPRWPESPVSPDGHNHD